MTDEDLVPLTSAQDDSAGPNSGPIRFSTPPSDQPHSPDAPAQTSPASPRLRAKLPPLRRLAARLGSRRTTSALMRARRLRLRQARKGHRPPRVRYLAAARVQ